jgi:hypothetical protein
VAKYDFAHTYRLLTSSQAFSVTAVGRSAHRFVGYSTNRPEDFKTAVNVKVYNYLV